MLFLPPFATAAASRGSAFGARREAPSDPGAVLATAIAGPEQRRLAIIVTAVSGLAFLAAAPFARVPLIPVPAFIPAYEAALVVVDLITAVLLFGQFAELRSAAFLAVAAGYLFDAVMVVAHALSFPGLLTPTGWLGAGSQTTAWLYMFWHGGFAVFIMAYAELNWRAGRGDQSLLGRWPVTSVIAAVVAIAIFLTLVATRADDLLPPIMAGNGYTPTLKFVVGAVLLLNLAAFFFLITNRPYSILDLWLIVVMLAWVFDIALSAVLNAGRFDLGFYAGRFFGLLATSFVLSVILVEANWLHAGLTAEARRRAEAAEALVRRVFETSLDLIMVTDRKGTLLRVSPSARPLLGYDPDELVGRSGAALVYADDLEVTRNEMRMARRSGTTQNFECRYIRKDGQIVTFWWMGVWSAAEQQHFFIGRDITERQALDRRLQEHTAELGRANRRLNAIIEAAPLSIFMLDPAGNVLLWTASAERLFGYTAEEATGGPPPYLDDSEFSVWRQAYARTVATASSGSYEAQRRCRDGTIIDASVTWAPVHNEDGTLLGIMYAIADVTERRKLESQLRQAQKMEAIGNLTGGMAHDFNNLLGVIIGNLDLLRELHGGDPEPDELSGEALNAALRGADLTRRLLAFARRQPLQPTKTDVNQLIGGTVKLLERTLGEEIQITLDLNPDTWPVVVDAAQLESALTNLATNARDAMPGGGQLILVTGNRALDADYASQHAEVQPGDYAMIEVSDTGTGMPAEVASRIFEPFFTTKEDGRGTGLGLSMVFGFIKQSGGHINVYSEVGIGTTFRLYLPRAEASADMAGAAFPANLARGRGEAVLAVEDNASLRRVVVRQLSELGYRVLEAQDAQAALAILESEAVDVLFTDIVMPGGTSGYELARLVLSRWPATKIVLTSGFPENKINGDVDLPNLRMLSKPYRRDDLARVLREVLDA